MKQLCALDGVSEVTPMESSKFKEKYQLKVEQQVDWGTSSKGTFGERVFVGFKGLDRPTVIVTEGYAASYGLSSNYEEELSTLFDANVILCEYRYFAESVPQPTNWDYMTVDNSLADYHHIRQVFGQLFKGKWISTGISKGGQTTMFYRATYPDDVDVSVSYVAPLNRAVEDGRHEKFLAKKVGTKEERKVIEQAMKEFMKKAKEHFDYVVIDTPPIALAGDAECFAGICDAAILVIKQGGSRAARINECLEALTASGVDVLGCIFNNVRSVDVLGLSATESGYDSNYKNYGSSFGEYSTGYGKQSGGYGSNNGGYGASKGGYGSYGGYGGYGGYGRNTNRPSSENGGNGGQSGDRPETR